MPGPVSLAARRDAYARVIDGRRLPLALVDLDLLEVNVDRVVERVRAARKRVRVATKSVRSVALLERIRDRAGDAMVGLMAAGVEEAARLVERGFDDVLVAYPTLQPRALARLAALAREPGRRVTLVVDDARHVEAVEAAAAAAGARVPLCVDVDASWRPAGGLAHVGVRRSPIRSAAAAVALAARIHGSPHLALAGVMAYEAQIAGLPDRGAGAALDGARRLVKRLSRRPVEALRAGVARAFAEAGLPLVLFNGGGSGSLAWASTEPALTEVTAGSAFLCGHLFDRYRDVRFEPAACFALEVVRAPAPGLVTCLGGGLVASGEAGRDRLPRPYLPAGLALLALEGAGEVQTPLAVPAGLALAPGDPVFFRHAKAGELAEHFDRYLLVRGAAVEGEAPTYRGDGIPLLG